MIMNLVFLAILSTVFMYLIILGADKSKTQQEKDLEDEAQEQYLSNLRKKM